MLRNLSVSNVVLIEKLDLEVEAGVTGLTGETGAGKSILLDALGIAIGGRSESRLVRKGADKASVIASFDLPEKHVAKHILKEHEIDIDAGEPLMLKRVVGADGKSKAFINDQLVSVALLKSIGDTLVEIHGQFETQGLLDPKTHRDILDDYAQMADELQALEAAWRAWQDTRKELADLDAKIARTDEEIEYLKTSIEDLERLNPQVGEAETLSEKKQLLMGMDAILQAFQSAKESIASNNGAEDRLFNACKGLEKVVEKAPEQISPLIGRLDEAISAMRDVVGDMESIAYDLNSDGESLEEVDDRLHAMRAQARKHDCFPDDLPEKLETLRADLEAIEQQDMHRDKLIAREIQTRKEYMDAAGVVTERRKKAAEKFATAVNAELAPLKLEKAKIFIDLDPLDETAWSAKGMDKITFTISTNPGQDPGPLNKIASGGELSRFMLAFKVVMAGTGLATTMIFDEIDAGVGGSTAAAIGQRLSKLGESKQVLVVTHSPQVAASANHHWVISKGATNSGDAIVTQVNPLAEGTQRKEEIARMLAGSKITEEARAAADRLLDGKAA